VEKRGEAHYIVRRTVGERKAETLILLEQLPVAIISADDQLVKEAVTIKSDYPVS
jgi:hypothetical protein